MKILGCIILVITYLAFSCSNSSEKKLPILGNYTIIGQDTLYPKVPKFEFINQDSVLINNETYKDKIYIADFVFLSCPTICPVMTNEMMKVYKTYQKEPSIFFLSHTIDPDNDTIGRLKNYATNFGIDSKKWSFVTGKKDEIYEIAENGYFSVAYEDSTAPGGFIHGGGLLLVDKNRHIRGVYDGTNSAETKRLINDIKLLLKE